MMTPLRPLPARRARTSAEASGNRLIFHPYRGVDQRQEERGHHCESGSQCTALGRRVPYPRAAERVLRTARFDWLERLARVLALGVMLAGARNPDDATTRAASRMRRGHEGRRRLPSGDSHE